MRKAYLLPLVVLALCFSMLALPSPAAAQFSVGISVRVGPPALPVYAQPICPGDGYIWTPGFWAWGSDGYYWVPGTWVLAPEPGLLWTPGWWGFAGGAYLWHPGYWGQHVGFYGGINYGHGYFGNGYAGGEWRGNHFFYNRSVTNVNINVIHNVYVNRNYRRVTTSRVAFNGGPHGINARPTAEQQRWDRERHVGRTSEQNRHDTDARNNRALHYSNNHGRPPIGATQRPGRFSGPGVVHPGQQRNQFHPPTNQNRPRGNHEAQPNRRPERPSNAAPRNNQPRPGQQGRNEPPRRGNEAPRGNKPAQRGHEARPHNEQHRGNGGEHGKGGNEHGGDHGHEDGRH
ncbi:MAG: YXWGXW repeat-containing protein [Candidatus Acidiferrales bacterium]